MKFSRSITLLFALPALCCTIARAQNAPRAADARASAAPATQPVAVAAVEEDEEEMPPLKPVGVIPATVIALNRDPKDELTRGDGEAAPFPRALSTHGGTGATTQPRPTLYFYLPRSTDKRVVATLNHGERTLKRWTLAPGTAVAGIYALTFEESDPPLEVSDDYKWFVEVRQYDSSSRNPIAESTLHRMPADAAPKIAGDADPAARVVALAEGGLYYDAVDGLLRGSLPALPESTLRGVSRDRKELFEVLKLKQAARQQPAPLR